MSDDPIKVTRDGETIREIPVERIALDYPSLSARAEACMGRTRNGDIWAAVGFNTGTYGSLEQTNRERLFHSADEGRTWTSNEMSPSGQARMCAFTVLQDDTFLLAVCAFTGGARNRIDVFASTDKGSTWEPAGHIAAAPYDEIGEGFLSMTQLADGTVLLPTNRWTGDDAGGELPAHSKESVVYRSADGGRNWGDRSPTFDYIHEPHIVQLASGKLLGAFRHQRVRLADDPPDVVEKWSAMSSEGVISNHGDTIFKHVFVGDSDDEGRTWKNLRPLLTREGKPLLVFGETHGQLVQLPDGRVVLTHDRRYPYEGYETRARVSHDEGRTWDPETCHVSYGAGYAASVALDDGTLVTVTGCTSFAPDSKPIGPWRAEAVRWRLPDG